MGNLTFILELFGTVAFAISGAITGIRKNMDILGVCVLGVVTAIGGGITRDVLAGDVPYIFVKHIYALAAAAGAFVCCICHSFTEMGASYIGGFAVVFLLRLCAAHFRWDLPKARPTKEEEKESSENKK